MPAFFCPSEMRVRRHSKIWYHLANNRYPGTLGAKEIAAVERISGETSCHGLHTYRDYLLV